MSAKKDPAVEQAAIRGHRGSAECRACTERLPWIPCDEHDLLWLRQGGGKGRVYMAKAFLEDKDARNQGGEKLARYYEYVVM